MNRAYRQRIAASKTHLAEQVTAIARRYPGDSVPEFVARVRRDLGAAITDEWASAVLRGY